MNVYICINYPSCEVEPTSPPYKHQVAHVVIHTLKVICCYTHASLNFCFFFFCMLHKAIVITHTDRTLFCRRLNSDSLSEEVSHMSCAIYRALEPLEIKLGGRWAFNS